MSAGVFVGENVEQRVRDRLADLLAEDGMKAQLAAVSAPQWYAEDTTRLLFELWDARRELAECQKRKRDKGAAAA